MKALSVGRLGALCQGKRRPLKWTLAVPLAKLSAQELLKKTAFYDERCVPAGQGLHLHLYRLRNK